MKQLNNIDALTGLLEKHGGLEIKVDLSAKIVKVIKAKVTGNRKYIYDAISKDLVRNKIDFTRYDSISYASVGHLKIGDIVIVLKPFDGAKEDLHSKTHQLAAYGKKEIMDLHHQINVPVFTFTKWQDVRDSIMCCLKESDHISAAIVSTFESYFKTFKQNPFKIQWNKNVTMSQRNELGKYLGEILSYMLCLAGFIPGMKATKIIVPNISTFSGIDGAIIV